MVQVFGRFTGCKGVNGLYVVIFEHSSHLSFGISGNRCQSAEVLPKTT